MGPVSRKPQKRFGPLKAIFIYLYLKNRDVFGLKLCMKGISVHIQNIMQPYGFRYCNGFAGVRTFRDLRETGASSCRTECRNQTKKNNKRTI